MFCCSQWLEVFDAGNQDIQLIAKSEIFCFILISKFMLIRMSAYMKLNDQLNKACLLKVFQFFGILMYTLIDK